MNSRFIRGALILFVWISFVSSSMAKEYDGLFFLGLNLHKDAFKEINVRYALNYAINREYIARSIMSEEVVPTGIIPPGMSGYEATTEGYKFDNKKAKKLLGKGIKFDLVLLHTDGIKTVAIAEQIKKDLKAAGVKISLKQVPYSDQEKWQEELASGQHHLFLMGYKADFLISPEAKVKADSYDLIRPLFGYGGEANFTFFHNPRVDNLLNQISELDPSVRELREAKIKEISRIIKKEAPTVNLFYIPKL